MLIAVVFLYEHFGGRLDYAFVLDNIHTLTAVEKKFLWISLFLMFAVKIPLFPIHS